MELNLTNKIVAVREEMQRLHDQLQKKDYEIDMLKKVIGDLQESNMRLLNENIYFKNHSGHAS